MDPEVWVAGRPVSTLCAWGELEMTHQWPFGSWELTWAAALRPAQRPVGWVAGAKVQCKIGSVILWNGNLLDMAWNTSDFAAVGTARQTEQAIALDATGKTTSVVDVALDQAFARAAIDGTRPASISNAAFGGTTETDEQNYIGPLLDAFSTSQSKRWWADENRAFRVAADPTVPFAAVTPDVGELGVSQEVQAATVFGRYLTSTGVYATASYGTGRPEIGVDLTPLGSFSSADATTFCQGIWSKLQGATGWTNPITILEGELLRGGVQMALWRFAAGPTGMIRLLNVRDPRGLSASTDVVCGRSILRPSQGSLQLDPIGLVRRTPGDVIKDAGGVML